MNTSELLAGLSLKAVIHTLGVEAVDAAALEELCGCTLDDLSSEDCWLSVEQWSGAAQYLQGLAEDEEELFFRAGRKCPELALFSGIEFLPWFISTPALLIRNLDVITNEWDNILTPRVDFISSSTCQVTFISRIGVLPPHQYFKFLQGYIIAALELWESTITEFHGSVEKTTGRWRFAISWQPKEYIHRRALEELMVEPEFFSELFEGLRRISARRNRRLDRLIRVSEQLRGAARKVPVMDGPKAAGSTGSASDEYISLLTNLYDGVITVDGSGNIVDVSPMALGMTGYADADRFRERYVTLNDLLGPDTDIPGHVIESANGAGSEHLFSFERPDGTIDELLLLVPGSADDGQGEHLKLILRDPSFQKRFHIELGRTRQFLEAIFLNNPSGLQIIDTEGWTVRVNPQLSRMFQFNVNRIVGRSKYNILEDPYLREKGLVAQLRRAIKGEHVQLNSVHLSRPEEDVSPFVSGLESPIIINLNAYPLKDHRGTVYNVVVSYSDITDSYLVQQQLSQIDKLQSIGTLASGIAHDFNNILGAIVPNADLIMHLVGENEQVRKKAQAIKTASKRASALTQQLISFARESHVDRKPLDLNYCVREAVELIGNAIPKNISIDFEPYPELPTVFADPLQMQQVLINLIINASDAMPKGGIIAIRTGEQELKDRASFGGNIIPEGLFVKLSVADSGVGIPRELLERVFDPFFTTKEKGRGTGLGLSVVHGIVKSHRGLIQIVTEENNGTIFDVLLPASEDTRSQEE